MRTRRSIESRWRSGALAALVLAASLAWGVPERLRAQAAPSSGGRFALAGCTVYVGPAEAAIPNGVVLVEDGRIVAVGPAGSVELPANAELIDCSGGAVTAGFWNSHVHFMERKWARAESLPAAELAAQLEEMLTRYGFTSVFDTGSMWDNTRRLRERIESGDVAGPRVRSTGETLVPPGAAPPELILDIKGSMRIATPEVAKGEEARAAAARLLDAGADGIKLYAATWAPPIVTLTAGAVEAAAAGAHRRGEPGFAHPSNREGLLAAVGGGVDVLVHTAPKSGPWEEELVAAMRAADVALIPTLKLWGYELRHDRISARERFVEGGIDQLATWLAAGGTVLFGTDVGYMADYDPTEEYVFMAAAGMDFRQILASLTTAPAGEFGESAARGRIAPGLAADLVVLDRDPASDVRAFAEVRYTMRDGRLIYRTAP